MRSWRDENILRQIVGVVADVKYDGLADEARSLVYVPHRQNPWGLMIVVVRAAGNPAALAEPLRREVARIDRDVAVGEVATLSTQAAASIATQRFAGLLLGLFAAAAALLAALGIYGVMAYTVVRRTREMGVRLALGADQRPSSRSWSGMGPCSRRPGSSWAWRVPRRRGASCAACCSASRRPIRSRSRACQLLLGAVALIACALPALRASRIEPLEALRGE